MAKLTVIRPPKEAPRIELVLSIDEAVQLRQVIEDRRAVWAPLNRWIADFVKVASW